MALPRISSVQRTLSRLGKVLAYALLGTAALAVILLLADLAISYGRIHAGVSVSGIDVGGMTRPEAEAKLARDLGARARLPLLLTHASKRWTAVPKDLGFHLEAERSAEKAYRVGRRGSLLDRLEDRALAWKEGRGAPAVFHLDEAKLKRKVDRLARAVDRSPVSSTVRVRGMEVSVLPSHLGFSLDKAALKLALKERALSQDRRIRLPVVMVPAPVTEREAAVAAGQARAILDQPVTLKHGDRTWALSRPLLGRLLMFRTVETSEEVELRAELNKEKLVGHIRSITADYHKEPKDAGFTLRGDKVGIVPSENGQEIDTSAAYARVVEVAGSDQTHEVLLTTKVLAPKRTTEQARAMGVKEKISSYTTTFSPSATSRVHNIMLLADSLDGALVPPGETFSFNGTIGPRTAEKGYKEAPIIVNGELVPGLGGGVCQVGTTTFNAIFFAGLPVMERRNHSIFISHYPAGRDATVSWGGPDLKFKNDTAAHVLIKAGYTRNSVTVSLWGTSPSRTVTYETTPFTKFSAFKVKKVTDPTLPPGKQVVEAEGIPGRQVSVRRMVKQAGALLFEDRFTSRYRSRVQVVRVGVQSVQSEGRTLATGPAETATGSPRSPAAPAPTFPSDVD